MRHRCSRSKDEVARGFKVSFGVTKEVGEGMLFGKVMSFDLKKSRGNYFSFLSFHSNNVTFSGKLIVGSDFLVVPSIGK